MCRKLLKKFSKRIEYGFFLDKNNIPYETEDYFAIYYGENIKE